jgi:uncharacterized membrane protein YagU involved in acid resistance
MKRGTELWVVAVGGSIAAALDITFAITFAAFNGLPPERLLQSVASGLIGKAAYTGGLPAAALGLALHFLMSFGFAAAFVLASKRIGVLLRGAAICGALFGVGVFLFMRLVVLPLSAFPHPVSFKPLATVLDLLSHMFLFGVPIALSARKFLTSSSSRWRS